MQGLENIKREKLAECIERLESFKALAILGPRQCGKSTLAKYIVSQFPGSVYLDLETPSDLQKLSEPELFFEQHAEKLVCLDEIQRQPDLFPILRGILDRGNRNGQILILGSASRDLIRQSSESLAGRIAYVELTPFSLVEVENLSQLWLQGGFPLSFLAKTQTKSFQWRLEFIRTYLERDIPQLGFNIPAQTLRRLWTMCAHNHGQLLNQSKLGDALGLSHTSIRSYLDLLAQTFMIRVLSPFETNVKKRLIKAPKVYIRDSGILHGLLNLVSFDDVLGHPVYGSSWEGMAMEQILNAAEGWEAGFYRTSAGAEIDLILSRPNQKIAIEFKASLAPQVKPGFRNALADLDISTAKVIYPGTDRYFIHKQVEVCSLKDLLEELKSTQ